MAQSVNKVVLVGELRQPPEIKYTQSGLTLAKLRITTNEQYQDRRGEWCDRTEWHNVTAWEHLGNIVQEHAQRGARMYIEGSLRTSSWEDRQTRKKRYRTEIVARNILVFSGTRPRMAPAEISQSVNRVFLLGEITRDPDAAYSPAGDLRTVFQLRTCDEHQDGEETIQTPHWHNVVAWGRLAEIVAEHAHEGDRLYLEGALRTGTWKSKHGHGKLSRTEVVMREFSFVGSKASIPHRFQQEPEDAYLESTS